MKDTAPIGLGILAVAGLFGFVGGGVAFVMWDFTFIGALFIAAIIAAIVILILWLGWREPATSPQEAQAAAKESIAAKKAETSAAAPAEESPKAEAPTAAAAATTAAAAPKVKPSATLPGEDELNERKGSWKYEGDADEAPKAEETKAAAPAADTEDRDGDGVVEGTDEGTKPATLKAARDGKADNLKEIKGIGPKLEKLCNSLGFYHFDQIAAWNADEVAWVDANLEGFKGRVTRDTWVAQAKILADGGETEFSKKVDKGGVY